MRCESLHHQETPQDAKQYMCAGDDHFAWKRSISLELCKRLCIAKGYDRFYQRSFKVHLTLFRVALTLQAKPQIFRLGFLSHTWVHLKAFETALVITQIQYSLFWSPIKCAQRLVRVCLLVWTTLRCVVLDSSFHQLSLT